MLKVRNVEKVKVRIIRCKKMLEQRNKMQKIVKGWNYKVQTNVKGQKYKMQSNAKGWNYKTQKNSKKWNYKMN